MARHVEPDMMMQEVAREDAGSAILFDAAVSPQVDAQWFEPAYWQARGALQTLQGGRGGVAVIDTAAGACVLRHYRRGGLVARFLGDRYLWRGADRTRGFRELRLLGLIADLGLPGPRPVATRYVRAGAYYRADLITRRIPQATTLAQVFAQGQLDAELAAATGALVARFHRVGIWHADLNAHNVLIATDGLHLVDFDRGEQRVPARAWQQANLERLKRSLHKLGSNAIDEGSFESTVWQPLLARYERTLHP